MKVDREKKCFCYNCQREFHSLGIMRHRAMHRDKKEDCSIQYSNGNIYIHEFSKLNKKKHKGNNFDL